MRGIKINIDTARLSSMTLRFDTHEDLPALTAEVALYSGNKKISTFSVSTGEYYAMAKVNFPIDAIGPIKMLEQIVERVVTAECNRALCMIEANPTE